MVRFISKHPALRKDVADGSCKGFIVLSSVGDGRVDVVVTEKVPSIEPSEGIGEVSRRDSVLRGEVRCNNPVPWFRDDW